MKLLIFIVLFLGSCGSSKNGGDDAGSNPNPHVSTSYYVSKVSDLIACDASSRGFLAYVKETSKFMACLEAGWTEVDVKGKDGASGTNGTNGTNGTMVSGNQWYDAVTNKMWVMTTIATTITGWSNSMSACTGSYRMPSPTEIQTALVHGMKACAQALVNAPTFILANDGQPYTVASGSLGSSTTAAQFCIAQ